MRRRLRGQEKEKQEIRWAFFRDIEISLLRAKSCRTLHVCTRIALRIAALRLQKLPT